MNMPSIPKKYEITMKTGRNFRTIRNVMINWFARRDHFIDIE